jgi:hypothetical protein
MEQQQQQQEEDMMNPPPPLHPAVQHTLFRYTMNPPPLHPVIQQTLYRFTVPGSEFTIFFNENYEIDGRSMQYLVDHVVACSQDDRHYSSQLYFHSHVRFSQEAFDVLLRAIEQNTMSTVTSFLMKCASGTATRLLEAFSNNASSSVTHLNVVEMTGPVQTMDISILTRLLQPTRASPIERYRSNLGLDGVDNNPEARRDFQLTLGTNQFIQRLSLTMAVSSSVAAMIFQALEHPTSSSTLESLVLGKIIKRDGSDGNDDLQNIMASLAVIKRLTELTLAGLNQHWNVLLDHHDQPWKVLLENGRLLHAMYKNSSLLQLGGLNETFYPLEQYALDIAKINMMCQTNALLKPRHRFRIRLIGPNSGIWYQAMAKLGTARRSSTASNQQGNDVVVDNENEGGGVQPINNNNNNIVIYPGASAIFKIFQHRPMIVERQVRRPADVAAAAAAGAALHQDEPPR